MIENPTRRVAAILMTALLLFSTIVVLPQATVSAASETNDIVIPVVDSNGLVTDASVTLTEVHTGNVIHAAYQSSVSAYVASGAPSGHYRLDVTAPGHYSFKDVSGFRFDGTSPYTKNPQITLTKFGNMQYTYTVNIKDASSNAVAGATVSFYNRALKQQVASNVTDASGQTLINIFGGTILDIVGSAVGFETNVTNVGSVSGPATVNMELNASSVMSGFAFKGTSGGIAKNVVSYLYNTNLNMPWEKRVLKSVGSYVRFDAYPGNWILVVDGSDVDPYVTSTVVAGSASINMNLAAQNQSTEDVEITMNSWNAMDIVTDSVWRAEETHAGLDFADIGSLRAQVDLALGNGNGVVSALEWSNLTLMLQNTHGPNYVTTSGLIHVNDNGLAANNTQYITSTVNSVVIGAYTGTVTSTALIAYSSDVSYTAQTALPVNASFYRSEFIVPYDSASMNRSFTLDLPTDYELVFNQTLTATVIVSGYDVVSIDPQMSVVAGSEAIRLDIGKSETPSAYAKILTAANAFAKKNATGVLLYYVVKNGTNVTFSAAGSADPNGNPLSYNWSFGDGSPAVITKSVETWHNYTVPQNRTVQFTVTDVTGKTNTTTFNVSVDGKDPRVTLNVRNSTDALLTGSISIDQSASLKFTPDGSVDDLMALNDHKGEIATYQWKFGDDAPILKAASSDPNITDNMTYVFRVAGSIKVVLNVTDVVGNYKNATVTITVKDKTAPIIGITQIVNATWGTSLLERKAVYFNANSTTDNLDNITDLAFTWQFGDGANVTGVGLAFANVTHNYSSYGQYNLVLNVTDLAGNNATLTRTVYVGAGSRPNVIGDKMTFDPKPFEEGIAGKITVNLTNTGSAVAKNITIELWSYSGSVAQKRIGNVTVSNFFDANGTAITQLNVGQSGYAVFYWTPDAKGNYTIRAIINSTDQKVENWAASSIDVNEAGWKKTALYSGVVVVIIVIPLLLFARRRIGSTGAMLRRPKKEKKEERREEKE